MSHSNVPDDILTAEQSPKGAKKNILMITADKTEDLEFFYPYYRFIEEGYHVDVATPDGGGFKGKMGYEFRHTKKIANVRAEDYDLLYIPGGKAPDALKKDKAAIQLTRNFVEQGKTISALCHGPQLLAAAEVIDGVNVTGYPEIEKELKKAGGVYLDDRTIVDGKFITARWPADLPYHLEETMKALKAA